MMTAHRWRKDTHFVCSLMELLESEVTRSALKGWRQEAGKIHSKVQVGYWKLVRGRKVVSWVRS